MNKLANAYAALGDNRQAAALHVEVLANYKRGWVLTTRRHHEYEQSGQRLCCAGRLQAGCGASCGRTWRSTNVRWVLTTTHVTMSMNNLANAKAALRQVAALHMEVQALRK
jgi:hypothetical protein